MHPLPTLARADGEQGAFGATGTLRAGGRVEWVQWVQWVVMGQAMNLERHPQPIGVRSDVRIGFLDDGGDDGVGIVSELINNQR